MSTPATAKGNDSSRSRDDTTRFLCGAAHRDEEFADSAIREYLVESTRSIPRSPGVNAGAVLREAVAGRTRRKVRDGLLLLLAVLVLFAATGTLAVAWLLVAAMVAVASGSKLASLRQRRVSPHGRGPAALGAIVSAIALLFALSKLIEEFDDISNYCRRRSEVCGPTHSDAEFTFVIIGIALIFAVLLADRVIIWLLVTKSFRRNGFRTSRGERELWRNEWAIRRLGHASYAGALALYPTDEDGGPDDPDAAQVIVYHGYRPFIGSGVMFEPWSMALPLEHAGDGTGAPLPGFALPELYERITSELVKTGRSPSFSPGHRLREMRTGDRVVISSVELVDHIDDAEARIVLPDKDHAPRSAVGRSVVDRLITEPMEWMRYFRSFQVETWDRDVVVSAYLTFGLDEEMLYVEWTPCILHPIHARHREIDVLAEQSVRPFLDALVDLLRFPASLPKRFATAVGWLTPVNQAEGTFVAGRYGATTSLRELASRSQVDNYFQLTDIERYVKVLESRLLRTLGEFLEEKGISVTEFMAQAMQVTSNNVHITGPVISSNIATTGKARAGNTSGTTTRGTS
ncbi:hypothetical protein [Lentzea jiangxiensis]|uniref:Uncharacterized protein n=1 Tax=Lentzea jiangxiensis TaxID=641025 RepID=A0A1H0FI22_9PSEU|nr:hypothetical protein [Lentzea jiangxiensis]SDN94325.1 hypothetical protein SAMN05421507_101791 [Lentzea jiangxiensis]